MVQEIKLGVSCPKSTLLIDEGNSISFADLEGKNIVLYFYPKDDTPGCTQEAKDFRDHIGDFKKLDAIVIGVSKDTLAKHKKFKDKYELPFMLASDVDVELCQKFGVWVEKSMYGRKYMGIDRSTFLIDKKGIVKKIWRKVSVKGHVLEVLKELEILREQ